MKKSLFIFFVSLLAVTLYAAPISKEKAKENVLHFIVSSNNGLRFSSSQIKDVNIRQVNLTSTTSPYYVFNINTNDGYVIVSGDDRTASILGYSYHGTFDESKIPENMKVWLEAYSRGIKQLDNIGITSEYEGKRTFKKPIPKLISSNWDQDIPYNNLCPKFEGDDEKFLPGQQHRPTGCVATALAQVMYYHKWPETKTLEIPSYTFEETEEFGGNGEKRFMPALPAIKFAWEDMQDRYDNNYSDKSAKAVAELMLYAGCSVEMLYALEVSGAYSDDLPYALRHYFGYDKGVRFLDRDGFSASEWEDIIYKEISEGRPVLYSGISTMGGHQFICDGYENEFFHINWGWSGVSDGYFRLSILDPKEQGIGGAGSGFSFEDCQQAIIGIQRPIEESIEPTDEVTVSRMILLGNTDGKFKKNKIGNIKALQIDTHFAYHGERNCELEVGYGFYNADGSFRRVIKSSLNSFTSGVNKHYFKAAVPFLKSDIKEDGKYFLKLVSKVNGKWELLPRSDVFYFDVIVKGDYVNIIQHPAMNYEIKDFQIKGTKCVNSKMCAEATILNRGYDLDGPVELYVNNNPTGIFRKIAIKKGDSQKFSIEFGLSDSGKKKISLAINGIVCTDDIEIDVKGMNTDDSDITITTNDNYKRGTDSLQISAIIKNNANTNYTNPIKAILYLDEKDKNGRYQDISYMSEYITIEPGMSKEISFTFKDLDYAKRYLLAFTYISGAEDSKGNRIPSEIFYGDKDDLGNPLLFFKGFNTSDAIICYDALGNKNDIMVENGGTYNISSSACFVSMPKELDKLVGGIKSAHI